MGVELRLPLFYLVQQVINFVSYFVATVAIPEAGGEPMFVVDFLNFSLQTDTFFTWSCNTLILHWFMSSIATNNYTCAPWELKPFTSQQESEILIPACTNDGKKPHNKTPGKSGSSFICLSLFLHWLQYQLPELPEFSLLPYYSVIMQLIHKRISAVLPLKKDDGETT